MEWMGIQIKSSLLMEMASYPRPSRRLAIAPKLLLGSGLFFAPESSTLASVAKLLGIAAAIHVLQSSSVGPLSHKKTRLPGTVSEFELPTKPQPDELTLGRGCARHDRAPIVAYNSERYCKKLELWWLTLDKKDGKV